MGTNSECSHHSSQQFYSRKNRLLQLFIGWMAGCGQQQIDKLQRVMNCAARVIYNCSRRDQVTPLLRDNLHWLCIRERILLKLCLMVYKALSGSAPSLIIIIIIIHL